MLSNGMARRIWHIMTAACIQRKLRGKFERVREYNVNLAARCLHTPSFNL